MNSILGLLGLVAVILIGYIVVEIFVTFGGRPTLQTAFASAVCATVFGLVVNPITGVLLAPSVAGLIAADFFGFVGGAMFLLAYDMGVKGR